MADVSRVAEASPSRLIPPTHDEELELDDAASTSSAEEALDYAREARDLPRSLGSPASASTSRASVVDDVVLPADRPVFRVRVQEMRFHPPHLEIPRGAVVQWELDPSCAVRHCLEVVTRDEEPRGASPAILPGVPWRHVFDELGAFHYRSLIYTFMKGCVTVVPPMSPAEAAAEAAAARARESSRRDAPVDDASEPRPSDEEFRTTEEPSAIDSHSDAHSDDDHPEVPYARLDSDDDEESLDLSRTSRGRTSDERSAASASVPDARPKVDAATTPSNLVPPPIPPPPASLETEMERRRAALLPGSGSRRWSCEKCKASFLSFVNLQRHRAAHRATGAGRRARLSPATREQLAACWDALDLDRRAKSLDFAKPGEAGALLLAGFRSRPATTSASTSGSFDDAFAKYRGGGEILRRAVAGDVRATGAALVAALEGASEGTALRGHKTTTDLERMVEDDNLEAALALLAEEALLRTYVAERSEAAEAAQRALVAEIDEAAAEEERRDARRAKAKAKKARRRSRRKGEDESGSAAVSTAGEGTEGETRDGDVDRDEDDAAAEAVLSRRREDARVDALAAEAAEREAREASAAEAAARRGRDDVRGGESGVKSRGDSAKSGAGTVVGRGRTDSTTAESSPGGGLVASPYGRPKTAPLAARAAKAAATTTSSSATATSSSATATSSSPESTPGARHPSTSKPRASISTPAANPPKPRAPSHPPEHSSQASKSHAPQKSTPPVPRPTTATATSSSPAPPLPPLPREPPSIRPRASAGSGGEKESAEVKKSRRQLAAARAERSAASATSGHSSADDRDRRGSDVGYQTSDSESTRTAATTTPRLSRKARAAAKAAARLEAATTANATNGEIRVRSTREIEDVSVETSTPTHPETRARASSKSPPPSRTIEEMLAAAGAAAAAADRASADVRAQIDAAKSEATRAEAILAAPVAAAEGMLTTPIAASSATPVGLEIPVAPVWTPPALTPTAPPPVAMPYPAYAAISTHVPYDPYGLSAMSTAPPMDPRARAVYMHHYATALAAIQASQAGAVAAQAGASAALPPPPPGPPPPPVAPPLPPGPPPSAPPPSRART